MNKPKIIVLVGPTASGKTTLSLEIAKRFGGEIIAADSRTVYRGMDIGTAKPKNDVRKDTGGGMPYAVDGIKHYGFDLVNPDEHFHAYDFKRFAEQKIAEMIERGHVPLIVGGTGLYVSGLIDNFDFEGGKKGEPQYEVLQIGVQVDRRVLYDRCDKRVDEMIKGGFIDEVRNLKDQYGCLAKSMTGIGYRQMCAYLDGKVSLDEAIETIKLDTRHYAKRQMTWFKRDKRIHWVEAIDQAIALIEDFLKQTQ